MAVYDQKVLEYFLEHQTQLFDEPVADTLEEADAFLDDCLAVVVKTLKEARAYLDEEMDITGMSNEELSEMSELFFLPDGRILIVEG